MSRWIPYRDEYLDNMVAREALPTPQPVPCVACCNTASMGLYRCQDCHGDRVLCKDCALDAHRWLPLHHLQVIPCLPSRTLELIANSSFSRYGQTVAFTQFPFKTLDCRCSWVTSMASHAAVPSKDTQILSYSTPRGTTLLALCFVTADPKDAPIGTSCSISDGTRRPRHNHKPRSPFDSSTRFIASRFRVRYRSTIITCQLSTKPTMRVFNDEW